MPAGANVDIGSVFTLDGLSAGSLNADLVPATYVEQYKWISLYVGPDSYSGVLSPQISYDQTHWKTVSMYPMDSLDAGDVSSVGFNSVTNRYYGCPVIAPYFRVRMTTYVSDFATGSLRLYQDGLPGFQLLDTYVRILTASNYIGRINNDGTQTAEITAGHAADTAVAVNGGMLASVLVTTTGTHAMTIYDNNAAASGTVIGVIPASATVNGVPFVYHMPTSLGIFVAGDPNNPGVTIAFT